MLVIENAETVIGRFAHRDGHIGVEHAILAGPTMAEVEVQATVWTVGLDGARLRTATDCVDGSADATAAPARRPRPLFAEMRPTMFVSRPSGCAASSLSAFGEFQHDPDWGFHGAFGSARVFVDVQPVLETSTAVRASSPVLSSVELQRGAGAASARPHLAAAVRRVPRTSPAGGRSGSST